MSAVDTLPDLLTERLPLLVVDDDESVLQVTRLVLSRYRFEGKGLEILEANSAASARDILQQRTDIAVVLLDVVMESDDAGLRLVEDIRNKLNNHVTRIVLRTGQAGYAPEHRVIQDYDINDYLSKADATQNRLFFSLTTALRSYRDILNADYLGRRVVQADKASLAKSQFLAHMSHEIRTPLNGLLGTVQLLTDTDASEEQKALLKDLGFTAEALLSIVNDVLDLAKIEAGKLELNPQSFSLPLLIEKVMAIFSANMRQKSISFSQTGLDSVPQCVTGDGVRIQQILMNFLSNALKFTPDGGQIVLDIRVLNQTDDQAQFRFEVCDSGIGISSERVDHIFEAYEQESVSTSQRFGGTGLGLSLCRNLAELMTGSVGVTSKEGSGSCFWLEVPLTLAPQQAPQDSSAVISLSHCTVALCEDDMTSRKVMVRMLEKLGAQVMAYENGQQLLDDNQFSQCDLIILDCHMPVKDGFETAVDLRTLGCTLPIVALTAGVSEEERQRCTESGMQNVLVKPVERAKLIQQISALVDPDKEPPLQ